MQCMYSKCSVELTNPKARTCSDAHRMAWKREGSPDSTLPITRTDTPEQTQPEHDNPNTVVQDFPHTFVPTDTPLYTDQSQDYAVATQHELQAAKRGVNTVQRNRPIPLEDKQVYRVSLPGDPDYVGVCTVDDQGAWHV